jgi:hypothetical protein
MRISISKSGERDTVIKDLLSDTSPDTQSISKAVADHLQEKAAPGSVSVSITGSVQYSRRPADEQG